MRGRTFWPMGETTHTPNREDTNTAAKRSHKCEAVTTTYACYICSTNHTQRQADGVKPPHSHCRSRAGQRPIRVELVQVDEVLQDGASVRSVLQGQR